MAAWRGIRSGLSRGNNIEEGHYAERLWAPLLTPPLEPNESRALSCGARVLPGEGAPRVEPFGPLRGLVGRCTCA